VSKKRMTAEEYYHKREEILQSYKLRQIKTGQEAQKMLNQLDEEFRKKR
jgi:hypothetical protein